MSQFTTGCPNCATKFRLTPEQLEIAEGMVRCGKCMGVFNASDNKIEVPQASSEELKEELNEETKALPVITELLHNEFDQQQTAIKDKTPNRVIAKLIIILLGAIVLAAQYSYFFSRELSQTEAYRKPLSSFCEHLGCSLDLFRDIDKHRVRQFMVQSDPNQPGALVVDLIIENRAQFHQPFPKIALRFADMQNQTVAERVFLAREYLAHNSTSLPAKPKLIPKGKQRRVNFRLVDPGIKAVNYSVALKEQ
jgi:predicted Zn finger-like uncharacterized protein